jgi:hypothetical protein
VTRTGTLPAGALISGTHTLWALADGQAAIAETSEVNNAASVTVVVGGGAAA